MSGHRRAATVALKSVFKSVKEGQAIVREGTAHARYRA